MTFSYGMNLFGILWNQSLLDLMILHSYIDSQRSDSLVPPNEYSAVWASVHNRLQRVDATGDEGARETPV